MPIYGHFFTDPKGNSRSHSNPPFSWGRGNDDHPVYQWYRSKMTYTNKGLRIKARITRDSLLRTSETINLSFQPIPFNGIMHFGCFGSEAHINLGNLWVGYESGKGMRSGDVTARTLGEVRYPCVMLVSILLNVFIDNPE